MIGHLHSCETNISYSSGQVIASLAESDQADIALFVLIALGQSRITQLEIRVAELEAPLKGQLHLFP